MRRPGVRYSVVAAIAVAGLAVAAAFLAGQRPRPITVDYPLEGSVFPPEFPAPTLIWRDASPRASAWTIDVSFGESAAPSLHATMRTTTWPRPSSRAAGRTKRSPSSGRPST